MANEIIHEKDVDAKDIIQDFVERNSNCFLGKIEGDRYIKTLVLVNTSFLPEFFDISTRVQYILREIEHPVCCEVCGNLVMKQLHGKHAKLYTTCCPSCAHKTKEYKDSVKNTMESRYGKGITNPMQVQRFVDKIQETDRRNHGGMLFNQTEEGRQVIRDRWSGMSDEERNHVIQKAIDTNKRNHGGTHSSSLEETKNKFRNTISKRTKDDWDRILKKSIEKWEQHYGRGIKNPS